MHSRQSYLFVAKKVIEGDFLLLVLKAEVKLEHLLPQSRILLAQGVAL
jgi:hypothetical protein